VPFEISGIKSGNFTYGHRFMAPDMITVRRFDDYEASLENAHVVLDAQRRADIIEHDAKDLALAAGLELIGDAALLKETAGLVEWPVVLMGSFDEAFLDVPPEVIITSIRSHQKCFALRNPGSGKLANKFLLVSNLIADDDGKAIVAGNERVIAARLSDAKFFWDQDRKLTLESRLPKLNDLIFHAKLGTVHDKAHAIAKLAMELAKFIPHADKQRCEQAALLAKADLVTDMVGEFPELQGLMGRYYALNDGCHEFVANAIAKHYAPQGPSDAVPLEPAEIVTALADKFYSLVGFFGIDERPTGSRDPYALRRSALGVIRIVLENKLRLKLMEWFVKTTEAYRDIGENVTRNWTQDYDVNVELLVFFADRLKVYLKDQGIKHDLIDAVFSLKNQDDLLMIESRIKALNQFLKTDDGQNLLSGYKRAVNIVRIEEKNDGPGIEYSGDVDPKFFEHDEERALHAQLQKVKQAAHEALDKEDFVSAMAAMAPLRGPVDAFFEAVTVNSDNKIVRRNRLCLLNQIRVTLGRVADFSKIEG
jgi:glycyl-tRNA synthetase beta chain